MYALKDIVFHQEPKLMHVMKQEHMYRVMEIIRKRLPFVLMEIVKHISTVFIDILIF